MIGRLLGNRYEIRELIDSGGMAYVYKAFCKKTQRIVAVKALKEKFAKSAEYVDRFKKEAQAAFSLEHPHIVRVFDVGYDKGVYYLVMEYIEGPSLKMLIDQRGGISEKKAIDYAIQICSALSAAHIKGIVHRDVKPHNILIDADGMARVTDFGIAKSITSDDENDNQVIGSIYYISPEQAKGDRVDGRSDIYSLGIVLYEMLTGTLPFTGEKTVSVALKHINEKLTPPRRKNAEISEAANNIVIKATSKAKRNRYRQMSDFKMDLMRALVEKDGAFVDIAQEYLPNKPDTILKPENLRKNRVWKIAILVVMLAAVTTVAVLGTNAIRSGQQISFAMPNLLEKSSTDAISVLNDLGLEIDIKTEMSNTVEQGVVMSQEPAEGEEISEGSEVQITVSDGLDYMVMPQLIGMTEAEAVIIIEEMELIVSDIIYEQSETLASGSVISQIPEQDEDVEAGEEVSLVVATEVEQNESNVPTVVEMPIEQAVVQLYETGYTNIFIYQDESEAEFGIVISQTPEPGLNEPLDREVYLTIRREENINFYGRAITEIEVAEDDTVICVVTEEEINGMPVKYVVNEISAQAGITSIDEDIFRTDGGTKTVLIYINNIVEHTFEVEMTDWSGIGEG